jgi:hypothetical protein
MSTPPDSHGSPQAEHTAAVARQRAEWKIANDLRLGPVERVIAYARWLAATERVKSLSRKWGDDEISGSPCPP